LAFKGDTWKEKPGNTGKKRIYLHDPSKKDRMGVIGIFDRKNARPGKGAAKID
jgi:hypothetical protein